MSDVANYNFEVWRGNHWIPELRWKAPTSPSDSTLIPVNLTGRTIKISIFYGETTITKDATITDAVAGEFKFTFTPAETRSFPLGGVAIYEIEVTTNGIQRTLQSGKIIVKGGNNAD